MTKITVYLTHGDCWTSPDNDAKAFMLAKEEILVVKTKQLTVRFPLINVAYWLEVKADSSQANHPSQGSVLRMKLSGMEQPAPYIDPEDDCDADD